MTRAATETEKIWIAGFVDGEGCVTIERANKTATNPMGGHTPRLFVSNTYLPAFDLFLEVYGGMVEKVENKTHPKWKIGYRWRCPSKILNLMITDIVPYLRVKHIQASLVGSFFELGLLKAPMKTPLDVWNSRELLYTSIKELNKKGTSHD